MASHYSTSSSQLSEPDLLLRPAPGRREGAQGYLLRLAEANCMTVTELTQLGGRYNIAWLTQHRLLPDPALDPDLHRHVERIGWLLEEKGRIWNQRSARFCPLCLAQDPTWRASWEIYFHDVCPVHGVWLVDQCSSCGQLVRWNRDSLLRCQCGSDLREESPGVAPDNLRRLSAALEDKLLGWAEDDITPPLAGLNVDQVQRLVRYLGAYMDPVSNRKPLKLRNADRLEISWPVSSLAAEIVFQWPQAFHESFSRLQKVSVGEKGGLREVFQRAYSYLYQGLSESAFLPVRAAFESWLAEHWKGGIARRNRRLSADLLETVQWIPVSVAARKLGIATTRLNRLVREGVLDGQESISTSGRRFMLVRRDQLDQATTHLAGDMTMSAAMESLGIGKVRMQRILRLLFPSARRYQSEGFLPWCVPRGEVEALLAIGIHLPVVGIPEENQVSFGYVLRHWNWTGDEIVALVEAAKSGTVMPQSLLDNARGISRWVFDVAQLRALQRGLNTGRSNWVSIPEMADIMEVKQAIAYWLTRNGFIRSEKLGNIKGIGSRVRRDELEQFLRTHVFGKELADLLGCSSTKVSILLSREGIFPLRGPGIYPCPQLIYVRSDQIQRYLAQATGSPPEAFKLVASPGPTNDAV